jgi:asparagine synthase (glutamine-hydrolysing)
MCGILGVISTKKEYLDKSDFTVALEKSKHRGPDGTDIKQITEHGLFGFNWLSIQDLKPEAMQPFHYMDNWLVFNGEIYNFVELREDLKKAGFEFHTTGDTEVLAAGLTHKGIDFLQDVNGIYGFCFYNSVKNEFLVARDRVGVKPLFYFQDHERFIFSSEVQSILTYIPTELDYSMIQTHLFLDRFIGSQKTKTFFKNIRQLEPGYYMVLGADGSLKTKTYYYKPDFKTTNNKDISEIENDFSVLADRAIHWETRSDVPIGMVLSGGIDSTFITTLATPYLVEKEKIIPTFTYYFNEKGEKTDLEYTQKLLDNLSQQYGEVFQRHALNLDKPFTLEDFMEAAIAREEPVVDIRYITKLKNYRTVQDAGLKVCFNGQGADEVFYGYYPLDYWMSIFYREGVFDTPNVIDYFKKLNALKMSGFTANFAEDAQKTSKEYVQSVFDEIGTQENQQKLVTAFIRENMLQTMLTSEDKFGMHSSVEVRVPTVNRLLVEFADACDYKVHIKSTTSGRHLFRKMIEDKLPKEIVYREKSPGPKKKNYSEELINIIDLHKDDMLKSPLLNKIFKPGFISELLTNDSAKEQTEAFYGNFNDLLVEIIGLYAFEKVFNPVLN